MIQIFKPDVGMEEWEALREVFESGWIGLGPKTAKLENRFALVTGARYAVATNSATAALHLSLLAWNLGLGDEVLVPSLTFVSTAHAVAYCGAKPVFVDIDPSTLLMDMDDARAKVNARTRAIIPMHYGGRPCDMREVKNIAMKRGLYVVEDAAHACGARYRGWPVGACKHSDVACFSFQAVKNMTTCDGGMITTNSAELDTLLRKLRWCGVDKSTWNRTVEKVDKPRWYYDVSCLGYKYHMNDIAAAIGLVQLNKLKRMNERRSEIAHMYERAFENENWIQRPVVPEYSESSWHNYVILVDDRDDLAKHLLTYEVETGVHYIPVHQHSFYADYDADVPVTDSLWKKLLTLPLHTKMTDEDVFQVIEGVLAYGR